MPKVFIYSDGQSTAPNSVADLATLLSNDAIFSSHPDIVVSDFTFTMDGLQQPVFVVPGGSAFMGTPLKKIFDTKVRPAMGENFDYLGVCAGGFAGTSDGEIFNLSTNGVYHTPTSYKSLRKEEANCGMISDYRALGPFHPTYGYESRGPNQYVPYIIKLKLKNSTVELPQLYINGPGFAANGLSPTTKVVANYSIGATFKYEHGEVEHPRLAAMISAPAEQNHGARFLAGTHIEACVPNSKMLSLFWHETPRSEALSYAEVKAFRDEREATYDKTVEILRDTFRRR